MKVLLGPLERGLDTKGLHSDPADKGFWVKNFVKNGVKTSTGGSCTKGLAYHFLNFKKVFLTFEFVHFITVSKK